MRRLVPVLCLVSCGPVIAKLPASETDPLTVTVSGHREVQRGELWRFDERLARRGAGDQCQALCSSHTLICGLATRICEAAKTNPAHERAKTTCEAATATCRDTNVRLPEECFCR